MRIKARIFYLLALSFCLLTLQAVSWAQGFIKLPQTGQTHCYDSSGTVIDCSGTGQDGEWRAGFEWPNPRFTNPDGTVPITQGEVLDRLTGLIWMRDAGTPTIGSCYLHNNGWLASVNYVACLNSINYLGHNNWRVPNINELENLVNAEVANTATWLNTQGFVNVYSSYLYWSSTTRGDYSYSDYAWFVDMREGNTGSLTKSSWSGYVWPVRSGQ